MDGFLFPPFAHAEEDLELLRKEAPLSPWLIITNQAEEGFNPPLI